MVSVEIELSDASDFSAASSGIDCADFFPFDVLFFFVVSSLDFDFRGGPSPSSPSPSFSTPFSPSFSVESSLLVDCIISFPAESVELSSSLSLGCPRSFCSSRHRS